MTNVRTIKAHYSARLVWGHFRNGHIVFDHFEGQGGSECNESFVSAAKAVAVEDFGLFTSWPLLDFITGVVGFDFDSPMRGVGTVEGRFISTGRVKVVQD